MPDLAIIIVSHNTRAELERCLATLHDTPTRVSHEIVVVDNGSRDGSVAAVHQRWPTVRVIEIAENLGFAAANNRGIRETASDLILLLNSDTLVPAGAIDILVAELADAPDCAILGPRLVDAHGAIEISFGAMMSPWNELRQKVLGTLHGRRIGWASRLVARRASRRREVHWVSGACLLVRRADAVAAGLLDERYFLYGEDVDFCEAVRARGRQVRFTPAADVVHERGRARASDPQASDAAYRASHLAFYAKHHPRWLGCLRVYLKIRGQLPEQLRK